MMASKCTSLSYNCRSACGYPLSCNFGGLNSQEEMVPQPWLHAVESWSVVIQLGKKKKLVTWFHQKRWCYNHDYLHWNLLFLLLNLARKRSSNCITLCRFSHSWITPKYLFIKEDVLRSKLSFQDVHKNILFASVLMQYVPSTAVRLDAWWSSTTNNYKQLCHQQKAF